MKAAKVLLLLLLCVAVALGGLMLASPEARFTARCLAWRVAAAPIGTVLRSAAEGDTVLLAGQVSAPLAVPLAKRSAFVLSDATGSVEVLADERAPPREVDVLVRGRVRRSPGLFGDEATGTVTIEAVEIVVPR